MDERKGAVGSEQGGGVGPDSIEGDEAEIEKAGDSDFEVEAHSHQDEEADHQQDLADEVAGIKREQDGEDGSGGKIGPP